jgi:hypothetical protein
MFIIIHLQTTIAMEQNSSEEITHEEQESLYYTMLDLFEEKQYSKLLEFIKLHNVDINERNDNNDNCLIFTAAENFDEDGIRFCIKNNCDKYDLGYACALIMGHYDSNSSKTLELIDYMIENNASVHPVYHRSLTWNCLPVHRHLLVKWKSQINFHWLGESLEICGRFGNYETIKAVLEIGEYKEIITNSILATCLKNAIYVDTFCDEARYKLIEFLTKDQNISLDTEYSGIDTERAKHLMRKIDYMLTNYKLANRSCNKLYMPDLFKSNKIISEHVL